LSAYTANLATFLIKTNLRSGITSVEQAVVLGKRICIPTGIADMISQRHPTAHLVKAPFYQCPKYIFDGQADVAIMSDNGVKFMYSGDRVRHDCKGLSPGSTPYCPERGGELDITRDCKLMKAGNGKILLTVPIAIPIRREIQHALSWAQVHSTEDDLLQRTMDRYSNRFPQPIMNCPPKGLGELDPMPVNGLLGTLLVSALFFGIALIIHVVMRKPGKSAGADNAIHPVSEMPSAEAEQEEVDTNFLKTAIGDIRRELRVQKRQSWQSDELQILSPSPDRAECGWQPISCA